MLEMLEMEFMQRAWLAGLIMAVICPLIGSFLVLRRQSLIGDGLGHIAFAGVAAGALWGASPVLSAAAATIVGALAIEKVRTKLSDAADMVLAIFFYSGMGLAVIFTGLNKDGGFNLGSILFGSLMMVSSKDLLIVAALGFCTVLFVVLFYRPACAEKSILRFCHHYHDYSGSRSSGIFLPDKRRGAEGGVHP